MSESPLEPRELRLSSTVRGITIGALIAFYTYVMDQPGASLTTSLLLAAALQLAVIVLRRFVPGYLLPRALYVFELLADAATVLLFALGVFGGMLRVGMEA